MSIGCDVVLLRLVSTTMDALDELAVSGAAEGTVVLADEQTAGYGRGGRQWSGPPGGIYCSVLLRPALRPEALGPLSLVLGVVVAEAIESIAPVRCDLKWPNDVLVGGRKVAGILVKTRLNATGIDYVNAGIGINVAQPLERLPPNATTLCAETAGAVDRTDVVFRRLLDALDQRYRQFIESGPEAALDAWQDRAAFLGEEVIVIQDDRELAGRFGGVDPQGRLLLTEGSGKTTAIVQGDLVRGPRRATSNEMND